MSNADTIHSAPSSLKSKVWKKFGFYMKNGALDKTIAIYKQCRTALKYTGSTTNLNTHLVRLHGETGDEEVSTVNTASTKTRQDTDIQDFFQPRLSHNSAGAKVVTANKQHKQIIILTTFTILKCLLVVDFVAQQSLFLSQTEAQTCMAELSVSSMLF